VLIDINMGGNVCTGTRTYLWFMV